MWKTGDTIQGRTLYKGGHYLRKYGSLTLGFGNLEFLICVFSDFSHWMRAKGLDNFFFSPALCWCCNYRIIGHRELEQRNRVVLALHCIGITFLKEQLGMIGYGLSGCRKAMHCQAGCGPVSWCLIKARPDRAWQTGPCWYISGTARITMLEAWMLAIALFTTDLRPGISKSTNQGRRSWSFW